MGIPVSMKYGRGGALKADGTSYTLLGSTELTVNTTSTSAASAGTITLDSSAYTADDIIYVTVRDKAGPRAGYFYGSDAWFCNYPKANGATSTLTAAGRQGFMYNSSNQYANAAASYGVYGYSITSAGVVTIRRRYNSSYGTINGTFEVKVYKLKFPAGANPFA